MQPRTVCASPLLGGDWLIVHEPSIAQDPSRPRARRFGSEGVSTSTSALPVDPRVRGITHRPTISSVSSYSIDNNSAFPPQTALMINNLATNVTEHYLQMYIFAKENVKYIKVLRTESGLHKGTAIVFFGTSAEAASNHKRIDNQTVVGRIVTASLLDHIQGPIRYDGTAFFSQSHETDAKLENLNADDQSQSDLDWSSAPDSLRSHAISSSTNHYARKSDFHVTIPNTNTSTKDLPHQRTGARSYEKIEEERGHHPRQSNLPNSSRSHHSAQSTHTPLMNSPEHYMMDSVSTLPTSHFRNTDEQITTLPTQAHNVSKPHPAQVAYSTLPPPPPPPPPLPPQYSSYRPSHAPTPTLSHTSSAAPPPVPVILATHTAQNNLHYSIPPVPPPVPSMVTGARESSHQHVTKPQATTPALPISSHYSHHASNGYESSSHGIKQSAPSSPSLSAYPSGVAQSRDIIMQLGDGQGADLTSPWDSGMRERSNSMSEAKPHKSFHGFHSEFSNERTQSSTASRTDSHKSADRDHLNPRTWTSTKEKGNRHEYRYSSRDGDDRKRQDDRNSRHHSSSSRSSGHHDSDRYRSSSRDYERHSTRDDYSTTYSKRRDEQRDSKHSTRDESDRSYEKAASKTEPRDSPGSFTKSRQLQESRELIIRNLLTSITVEMLQPRFFEHFLQNFRTLAINDLVRMGVQSALIEASQQTSLLLQSQAKVQLQDQSVKDVSRTQKLAKVPESKVRDAGRDGDTRLNGDMHRGRIQTNDETPFQPSPSKEKRNHSSADTKKLASKDPDSVKKHSKKRHIADNDGSEEDFEDDYKNNAEEGTYSYRQSSKRRILSDDESEDHDEFKEAMKQGDERRYPSSQRVEKVSAKPSTPQASRRNAENSRTENIAVSGSKRDHSKLTKASRELSDEIMNESQSRGTNVDSSVGQASNLMAREVANSPTTLSARKQNSSLHSLASSGEDERYMCAVLEEALSSGDLSEKSKEAIQKMAQHATKEWRVSLSGAARCDPYAKIPDVVKSKNMSDFMNIQQWKEAPTPSRKAIDRTMTRGRIELESNLLRYNILSKREKLLTFQRSSIHNYGLFALEAINQNEMVIEYIGEIVRERVADIREIRYQMDGGSYMFRIDRNHVIDATYKGNLARFINHSCDPNCHAQIISVENTKRIVIYAKKYIEKGEEITYNYRFPLEEKKIPCYCGATACKKYLN
eukprot:TRINITY_DN6382_c0_g1_i2.p1 TRINITY_DN6382_c0_g1~~TRINITY_DN6382_c0_g1_i2.p1  ORF type:complete len:1204 (+),score=171.94 TRINITY_DN6382_c0_g1_i2:45-3656(+)